VIIIILFIIVDMIIIVDMPIKIYPPDFSYYSCFSNLAYAMA
jgi:hypothetical protein